MSVAWDLTEGWTVQQVPSSLPPLFSGDRLVVYGLLKPSENAKHRMNKVRLTGTLGNEEKMEHFISFSTPPVRNAYFMGSITNSSVLLHCLAAKTFIKVKQDDIIGMWEIQFAKSSIISVSKSASVVSKFTSFVAVDEESHQIVSGPLRKQFVPSFAPPPAGFLKPQCLNDSGIQTLSAVNSACDSFSAQLHVLSKGSSGFKSYSKVSGVLTAAVGSSFKSKSSPIVGGAPPRPHPPPGAARPSGACSSVFGGALPHAPPPPSFGLSLKMAAPPSNVAQEKEASGVMSVISLQKASGAWDLTDQLVSLCGKSRDSLITGCPAAIAVDTSEGKLLWATALALSLLMGKFGGKKDEWEMIAEKGKKWIRKTLPANLKDDEVLKFAAAAIGVQIY